MSTPNGDNPWHLPGEPVKPDEPSSGAPAYGQPSSPSYGKYGQGTAVPPPPPAAPPNPATAPDPAAPAQWGQPPAPGRPQWGQPGYVAPPQGGGPAPGDPTTLQPMGALGPATIGFSLLLTVSLLAAAAFTPNQHQFIKDTLDAAQNGTEPPRADRGGSNIASSLLLLVEIGVWVSVCLWLTRVRQNVVVLRQYGRRRSEFWVWAGWIVPIVSFWFPLQVVTDVVRSTAAAVGVPPIRTGFWWTAWLCALLTSGLVTGSSLLPPDQTLHLSLVGLDVVVTVIALVLWLRIVLWLNRHQEAQIGWSGAATLER